ncbi:MAG: M15 family metallopeptidase [Erysipelotrichaceae bacterium]|nr:M15 family metallopeptidase [Erysipelotrichaceae bacterium]
MKRILIAASVLLLSLFMFTGCTNRADNGYELDYLVLVNKLNPLPDDWEGKIKTVNFTNTVGNNVEVEKRAYDAYLKLKKDLKKEGIYVDLDSARRSIAEQQQIIEDFTEQYGADYTAKVVAKPGYSEHHTGLALDLYLIIDGVNVDENEDMMQYPEIWKVIHEKLDDYGFILRYLPDKEHITGYAYEPWHIRYVNDKEIAKEIMEKGITFEGYLGTVNETEVSIDYGKSVLYTKAELDEVFTRIKCQFASWKGVELHALRYAGDTCNNDENLAWLNSINGTNYSRIIEVFSDFHTPKDGFGTMEADHDYTDYQWWLACGEDGDWDIVSFGY